LQRYLPFSNRFSEGLRIEKLTLKDRIYFPHWRPIRRKKEEVCIPEKLLMFEKWGDKSGRELPGCHETEVGAKYFVKMAHEGKGGIGGLKSQYLRRRTLVSTMKR